MYCYIYEYCYWVKNYLLLRENMLSNELTVTLQLRSRIEACTIPLMNCASLSKTNFKKCSDCTATSDLRINLDVPAVQFDQQRIEKAIAVFTSRRWQVSRFVYLQKRNLLLSRAKLCSPITHHSQFSLQWLNHL